MGGHCGEVVKEYPQNSIAVFGKTINKFFVFF